MARSFNGSSDWINCGTGASVGAAGPWSISAWVRPNAIGSYAIANKRTSFASGSDQYSLSLDSGGSIGIQVNAQFTIASQSYNVGAWNQISAACDASGAAPYLNGVACTFSGTGTNFTGNWASGTGTTQTFQIGALDNATSGFMNGRIADVAVWNVKLTPLELTALAAGVRPERIRPGNLVAWLPLDGSASPEPDLSGNKNNGTLTGTAPAFGPPFTLYTPHWPQVAPFVAPTSILWAQSAM